MPVLDSVDELTAEMAFVFRVTHIESRTDPFRERWAEEINADRAVS